MKLGARIIFSVMIFFSVIFLCGGYALISYFFEITVNREVEAAVGQYQYHKFVVQAYLITKGEEWFAEAAQGRYDFGSMFADMDGNVALYTQNHSILYSDFPAGTDVSGLLGNVDQDTADYQFLRINNRMYLIVAGMATHEGTGIYLVTGTDAERMLEQQEQIVGKFGAVYAVAVGMGAVLIFGLSLLITKPVKQLTVAAGKIADGDYGERVREGGSDEVGELAGHFNRMAAAVEEKVQELSENARQKEDFVANFAHELKTPLTSVIGYANRIYQKELPREEQKKAAWYIWNEGMRLEALSQKLMDLTLLNHKDFRLQEMESDVVFRELAADVAYLMEEKGVALDCSVEPAYIDVEYDLFKTLFLNLVDNAVKAGAKKIQVRGSMEKKESGETAVGKCAARKASPAEKDDSAGKAIPAEKGDSAGKAIPAEKGDSARKAIPAEKGDSARKAIPAEKGDSAGKAIPAEKGDSVGKASPARKDGLTGKGFYVIWIQDDGRGIPPQEIRKITEAFYMVDKSRSRKQHGAGIGLALAEKIVEIHGGSLEFESDGKSGTTARLCLKCRGAVEHEER